MRFPSGKLVATKLVMSSNEVTHLRVSLLCSCWASHCATVRVIMAAMLEFCGMLRLFNSSGILALWNNIMYVAGPFRKKKRKKKHCNVMSTPSHHRIYCKLFCIIMMYTANLEYQKHCTLFVSSDSYTLAMEGLGLRMFWCT